MQSLEETLASMSASFADFIPEIILFAGIILLVIVGLFKKNQSIVPIAVLLISLISSIIVLVGSPGGSRPLFEGLFFKSDFANTMKILCDVGVIIATMMVVGEGKGRFRAELCTFFLCIALGSHLLLMSTNLIVIFLSIELLSLTSYVLASFAFDQRSSEGALKYFLFGATASAVMLYGFSLLYGMTGTLDITSPGFDLAINGGGPLFLLASIMSLAGLLFKMAGAPMHLWAPDVYEAAPIPVIALLSVVPKIAALGFTAVFIHKLPVPRVGLDWQMISAVIALITITIGNLSALWQSNAKRMMAYSSIAQTGFLLIGVVAFSDEGIRFMIFYAAVYLALNFAVFSFLQYFESRGISSVEQFAGAGKHWLVPMIGLLVALIGLTGLPPTGGFTSKLFVFSALFDAYLAADKPLLMWLLVFGLINTVIALFYYLKIPYYAFFKEGISHSKGETRALPNLLGLILVVFIVAVFFIPGLLMSLINSVNFVF